MTLNIGKHEREIKKREELNKTKKLFSYSKYSATVSFCKFSNCFRVSTYSETLIKNLLWNSSLCLNSF